MMMDGMLLMTLLWIITLAVIVGLTVWVVKQLQRR